MKAPSPWWNPSVYADRRDTLIMRGRIKSAIRNWFLDEAFVEVEPGILQRSPGNEIHLQAFQTELVRPDGVREPYYLHTSPEFACKKLLAAGEPKIFAFTPVFRNAEQSALHAPEFTMLEWYRADQPYTAVMDDCTSLLRITAATADNRFVSWRGKTSNPRAEAERLSVPEAFKRHTGIDLLQTLGDGGHRDAFAEAANAAGVRIATDDDWSDIFSKVLTALIEPHLGIGQPTLLYGYPAREAAMARPDDLDPRIAERFELYLTGVELANGFGELTDAHEQRRRLSAEMDEKERRYGERYPIDEDFIHALSIMPPACGCALGFDRLVMLAVGATRIEQVLWTPLSGSF